MIPLSLVGRVEGASIICHHDRLRLIVLPGLLLQKLERFLLVDEAVMLGHNGIRKLLIGVLVNRVRRLHKFNRRPVRIVEYFVIIRHAAARQSVAGATAIRMRHVRYVIGPFRRLRIEYHLLLLHQYVLKLLLGLCYLLVRFLLFFVLIVVTVVFVFLCLVLVISPELGRMCHFGIPLSQNAGLGSLAVYTQLRVIIPIPASRLACPEVRCVIATVEERPVLTPTRRQRPLLGQLLLTATPIVRCIFCRVVGIYHLLINPTFHILPLLPNNFDFFFVFSPLRRILDLHETCRQLGLDYLHLLNAELRAYLLQLLIHPLQLIVLRLQFFFLLDVFLDQFFIKFLMLLFAHLKFIKAADLPHRARGLTALRRIVV